MKLFGATAIGAAMLMGCNSGSSTSTTPTEGGKKTEYVVSVIAKSNGNPVFQSARKGAEDAAVELSKKYGTKISVNWRTPDTEDGQVQAQRIAQAANEGSDAILMSCSDATKVTGAINDAVAKGVQVMTFDSDAPDSKRFAFYGADDMAVGKQVLDELAKQMGEKGTVAILAGNQTAPNLQKRVQGVLEAAKAHPGLKVIPTAFYHPETPQDAATAVQRAMKSNPEITGWAMIGGWPLFTKTLLTDLDPNKVKVVAVDALPAQLAYIEKGIAPVLLAQPTYEWGHHCMQIIMEKLIDKKDVPVVNKMDLIRVDKAGLGKWARQLQTWGFQDIDPKYISMP